MAKQEGGIERKQGGLIRRQKLLANYRRARFGAKSEKAIRTDITWCEKTLKPPWPLSVLTTQQLTHQRQRRLQSRVSVAVSCGNPPAFNGVQL
jgi:hypothetical protein